MTETDWLASDDPGEMLRYLLEVARPRTEEGGGGVPGTSDRKLRLWVEACRQAIAPGRTNWGYDLDDPEHLRGAVADWSRRDNEDDHGTAASRAILLREIVGNPFRPVMLPAGPPCRKCRGKGKRPSGAGGAVDRPSHRPCEVCKGTGHGPCPWITPDVLAIAQAAYDQRDEVSSHLDPVRLLILADGLEEVGCTEAAVLEHLRSPGPHVRGCWAIDLILGKE